MAQSTHATPDWTTLNAAATPSIGERWGTVYDVTGEPLGTATIRDETGALNLTIDRPLPSSSNSSPAQRGRPMRDSVLRFLDLEAEVDLDYEDEDEDVDEEQGETMTQSSRWLH